MFRHNVAVGTKRLDTRQPFLGFCAAGCGDIRIQYYRAVTTVFSASGCGLIYTKNNVFGLQNEPYCIAEFDIHRTFQDTCLSSTKNCTSNIQN